MILTILISRIRFSQRHLIILKFYDILDKMAFSLHGILKMPYAKAELCPEKKTQGLDHNGPLYFFWENF